MDTGTVKLADFGASTKMAFGETQSTSTIKGTHPILPYPTLPYLIKSCMQFAIRLSGHLC